MPRCHGPASRTPAATCLAQAPSLSCQVMNMCHGPAFLMRLTFAWPQARTLECATQHAHALAKCCAVLLPTAWPQAHTIGHALPQPSLLSAWFGRACMVQHPPLNSSPASACNRQRFRNGLQVTYRSAEAAQISSKTNTQGGIRAGWFSGERPGMYSCTGELLHGLHCTINKSHDVPKLNTPSHSQRKHTHMMHITCQVHTSIMQRRAACYSG